MPLKNVFLCNSGLKAFHFWASLSCSIYYLVCLFRLSESSESTVWLVMTFFWDPWTRWEASITGNDLRTDYLLFCGEIFVLRFIPGRVSLSKSERPSKVSYFGLNKAAVVATGEFKSWILFDDLFDVWFTLLLGLIYLSSFISSLLTGFFEALSFNLSIVFLCE